MRAGCRVIMLLNEGEEVVLDLRHEIAHLVDAAGTFGRHQHDMQGYPVLGIVALKGARCEPDWVMLVDLLQLGTQLNFLDSLYRVRMHFLALKSKMLA